MKHLRIRYQRLSDAKRFFEILSDPEFAYIPRPKSLKSEKDFLRKTIERRRKGVEHSFAIVEGMRVIGAVGLKVDQHRKHIGEVGYFVDRKYWGKGIAGRAVRLVEPFALRTLGITRLEIVTLRANRASQRVALKCGYALEGVQRGKQLHKGKLHDVKLFAKLLRSKPVGSRQKV